MNDTPRANRLHIGLFGKRNAGKSSLINALTDQEQPLYRISPARPPTRFLRPWKSMVSVPAYSLIRPDSTTKASWANYAYPPDTACAGENRHRPNGLYRRASGRRVALGERLLKEKTCTCYLDTEQMRSLLSGDEQTHAPHRTEMRTGSPISEHPTPERTGRHPAAASQ